MSDRQDNFEKACGYGICISLLLMIGIILTILSYSYVEYNEYAFYTNKITKNVNTETVFTNGQYFWGLFGAPIKFPRNYQVLNLSEISVGDNQETAFRVSATLFYRLIPDKLADLYHNFGTNYATRVAARAEATIKNTFPKFSINNYLLNRYNITNIINTELTISLNEIYIQLEQFKFELLDIQLEQSTINKYIDIAIQLQKNQEVQHKQEAQLIRRQTDILIEEITANITRIIQNAQINAVRINEEAKSKAQEIINTARLLNIADLINKLNITDNVDKIEFIRLINLIDNKDSINKLLMGTQGNLLVSV